MFSKRKKFSKIYDKYIDKIYRFILIKVSSREVAQDLSSETFLKGWQAYQKNSKIDNPSAFLYRIARNLVIDYYRQKGRTQFVPVEEVSFLNDNDNPQEKAILNSEIEEIKALLANLKEDYQNVIIWHYLDDLPIAKVAKMMDKTETNTRVLLHRALKTLRDEINKRNIREA